MCNHFQQLATLCAGQPPITCSCAGTGGSLNFSGLNLNSPPNAALTLQFFDCKPSVCTCPQGNSAQVNRPNIPNLPRDVIAKIVNAAFATPASCPAGK